MTTPQESTSSPQGAVWQYIRILWKRRIMVGCGSLLPALALAGLMYLQTGAYKATFVYERALTEGEYNVLLRRFYSSENLGKIAGLLRAKGLTDYAGKLDEASTEESLQQLIGFKVFPAYPKRLQTTDPLVSERIAAFQAHLLYVDIRGDSRRNMEAICDIVTANIENVLPVYDIRMDLKEAIRLAKVQVADIEDKRFTMSLDLQREQAKLAQMKKVEEDASAVTSSLSATGPQGGVILQVANDPNNRDLLPWPYQVRSVQAKIIDLEQGLKSDKEKYNYLLKLLALNGRLLKAVEQNLLKYYTAPEFVDYLEEEFRQCKEEPVRDYLQSYIRKTQNRVLINTRAGERPIVYPVSKEALRNGVLAFLVLLMATGFVAVALEHQNGQGRQT